jgi:large subunit ribosomal protein L25
VRQQAAARRIIQLKATKMATKHEISAELRTDEGKGASRRLRRSGKVPAVVYGAKQEPVSIQLPHNDTLLASHNEWFYSAILDLTVGGSTQKVLLRDMQRHPFKPQLLHLDFQRVNENEAIRIRVPLHFLNQESSPAGKTSGVVITHELNEVEISCLPKDLPEFIEVDLGALGVGDIVHLSALKLPNGVSIPELKLGKEHDVAVAIAKVMKEEAEAAPAEGDAAAAAPAAGAAAAGKAAPAAKAAPAKDEKKK